MMLEKKDILWRTYLVCFILCLFSLAIISKAVVIQFVEGEFWKSTAKSTTTAYKNIEAVRGNIYSDDGSLLATSLPIYEVRMDLNAEAITDKIFIENIDSLSICLAELFHDKSGTSYKHELTQARRNGERFHLIQRKINYTQLKLLKKFPLFRMGRYKGGLIYLQRNIRKKPFGYLAVRTIGYDREAGKPVGLEGAYTNELKGVSGKRLMQKISGGVWMPIHDENEIEPQDGCDLYSTININFQDVAEQALMEQLIKNEADHGCVVLMEVATGAVKAIANLSKDAENDYYEYYNYAIGESTEPGSTFKLASLIAAMEDGYIDITDSVDTDEGKIHFFDRTISDSQKGGYGKITIQRAFEVSSNVAISKIITQYYSKNPQKFVDRLYKMRLNENLNMEIAGEGKPVIKKTTDKSWSGTTLPWMSYGYEVQLTPMQLLTFYNAIANNGKMVKPLFVKEIRKRGKQIKSFKTEVIDNAICSKSTIEKAKKMLEGVVDNGTAKNISSPNYKIAGKTGTAMIANTKYGYKYNSKVSYQASFVGYFPADNPKYSCIVVINGPSKDVYYGNVVAGPIFKEISDKVYANSLDILNELKQQSLTTEKHYIPYSKNGYQEDLKTVFSELEIKTHSYTKNKWVATQTQKDTVEILLRKVQEGIIPNVVGMGAQDAVFLLENMGIYVKIIGKGVVNSQSITPGSKRIKGEYIILELG